VRVPSGKTPIDLGIFLISLVKLFIDSIAFLLFCRSTNINPALSTMDLKIGILLNSFFAINTVYLLVAINNKGISMSEAWLAENI
jgi:hypothetical protein